MKFTFHIGENPHMDEMWRFKYGNPSWRLAYKKSIGTQKLYGMVYPVYKGCWWTIPEKYMRLFTFAVN